MEEKRIFVTGTMRTGSSLVSNALSVHSKILILSERVHFFRFIYNKYDPLNENNVLRMLLEQRARLFHRFGVELEAERVLAGIKKRGFTYPVVYDEMMKYYTRQMGKEIWGDDSALEWREIPVFLKFFPKGKAIHIYRDPRAIMVSWKRTSGLPSRGYLNSLFNFIDSMNYVDLYLSTLPAESYLPIKFEELVADPESGMHKMCDFLEIDFEDIMLKPELWEEALKSAPISLGVSSFEGKVTGFSSTRANRWKDIIERWELCLAESLAGDILTRHGYELVGKDFTAADFAEALKKIKENDFLLKQFFVYLVAGEGVNKYPTDPTDYRNWNNNVELKKWFKDSPRAEGYLKEMEKISARFGK